MSGELEDPEQGPTPRTKPRGRRRKRLSSQATEERMFEAGRAVLREQGVVLSLDDLNMDEVITRAGVPRSSVYRIWPSKSDYTHALLMNLAGPDWIGSTGFDLATMKAAAHVVLRRWGDLAGPEGRRSVMLETTQVAVSMNYQSFIDSNTWSVYFALAATSRGMATRAADDDLIQEVLHTVVVEEDKFLDAVAGFYQLMGSLFGLRLRPGLSFRQLAVACAAVLEGLAVRSLLGEGAKALTGSRWEVSTTLPSLFASNLSAPDSAPGADDWSLPELSFLAILDGFTEPDPDWELTPELLEVLRYTVEDLQTETEAVD